MGFWDKVTSQFIEIIEWMDDDHETLAWRFPVRGQEIKNGAQLVVREGQSAVFVNEGKIADLFAPGTHTLTTQNLPILSTLQGWKHGFNSPFKAEVYFIATTQFPDLKWGTQNPIMMRDSELGAVRLRAFGTFSIRVDDATTFMKQLVGTDSAFELDEIIGQLKHLLVSHFTESLATQKVPVLDLAANYREIGKRLSPLLEADFKEMGLTLAKFYIENISLPPEVEKVLDKRSEMGLIGNVQQYAAYQAASAIPDAAKTPNSMAGAGMGAAAGFAMGNQMMNAFTQPAPAAPAPATAAPAAAVGAASADDMATRLKKLDSLKAAGVLTEDEYTQKRQQIISEI